MSTTDTRPVHLFVSWKIWITYGVLLAVGIPWYWPAGDVSTWFGIPRWVVVAVGASAAVSIFTACLLSRPWSQEHEPQEDDSSEREGA